VEVFNKLVEIVKMYYNGEEDIRRKVLGKYLEMIGDGGVNET